jgi:hypothetical protein
LGLEKKNGKNEEWFKQTENMWVTGHEANRHTSGIGIKMDSTNRFKVCLVNRLEWFFRGRWKIMSCRIDSMLKDHSLRIAT